MPRASKPDNPSIRSFMRRSVSSRLDRLFGVVRIVADVEVDVAAGMRADPTTAFSPVSRSKVGVAIVELFWSAGMLLEDWYQRTVAPDIPNEQCEGGKTGG